MNHSSMSGMDESSMTCSMSMLGNWDTIGACFLTSSWMVKSEAQFAGSCIGVFLLVVLIESIRRWGREWDRYIVRQAATTTSRRRRSNIDRKSSTQKALAQTGSSSDVASEQEKPSSRKEDCESQMHEGHEEIQVTNLSRRGGSAASSSPRPPRGAAALCKIESAFFGLPKNSPGARALAEYQAGLAPMFRPTPFQQFIRSLVYAIQFTGAYIVMLIAMSYNGYIILSIVLGGFVGHYFSTWDTLTFEMDASEDDVQLMGQDSSLGSAHAAVRSDSVYQNNSGACCN